MNWLMLLQSIMASVTAGLFVLASFMVYAHFRRESQTRKINAFIAKKKAERLWSDDVRWGFELARKRELREAMDRASKARKG